MEKIRKMTLALYLLMLLLIIFKEEWLLYPVDINILDLKIKISIGMILLIPLTIYEIIHLLIVYNKKVSKKQENNDILD